MNDRDVLVRFITESNAIEGIRRPPTDNEVAATDVFLHLKQPTLPDLCALVTAYEPHAIVRSQPGMGVRVGNYVAPHGGPLVVIQLESMLLDLHGTRPFTFHKRYEDLHPFTDGNGRSGRTLWLWQMIQKGRDSQLGFLHTWYYQSLER